MYNISLPLIFRYVLRFVTLYYFVTYIYCYVQHFFTYYISLCTTFRYVLRFLTLQHFVTYNFLLRTTFRYVHILLRRIFRCVSLLHFFILFSIYHSYMYFYLISFYNLVEEFMKIWITSSKYKSHVWIFTKRTIKILLYRDSRS